MSKKISGLLLTILLLSPGALLAGEDYETFKGLERQFVIDLPAGWSVYDQTKAMTGKARIESKEIRKRGLLREMASALGVADVETKQHFAYAHASGVEIKNEYDLFEQDGDDDRKGCRASVRVHSWAAFLQICRIVKADREFNETKTP